jgi:hypothetical protein
MKTPLWKRTLRTLGLAAGVLAVLGVVLVVFFEDKFIYFPVQGDPGHSPGENVELTASDGVKLHAWFLSRPSEPWTILHLHGNAGNLGHRADLLRNLSSLGASVLAIDYRGYGKSGGVPSEAGLYADARAAYDWLAVRKTPASRIILHGESLGAAVAAELATQVPCGGLVIQSGFTSTPDLSSRVLPWFPARWLMRTRYDTNAKLPSIRVPKLFIHSRQDEMIPFEMAERNFAVAPEPKFHAWFMLAGHNDLEIRFGRKYLASWSEFLSKLPR